MNPNSRWFPHTEQEGGSLIRRFCQSRMVTVNSFNFLFYTLNFLWAFFRSCGFGALLSNSFANALPNDFDVHQFSFPQKSLLWHSFIAPPSHSHSSDIRGLFLSPSYNEAPDTSDPENDDRASPSASGWCFFFLQRLTISVVVFQCYYWDHNPREI